MTSTTVEVPICDSRMHTYMHNIEARNAMVVLF